jgi:hypothetical protein
MVATTQMAPKTNSQLKFLEAHYSIENISGYFLNAVNLKINRQPQKIQ